ncbi:hypothetical protein [Saccharibacillus sacchari]|uniref:Uncharacterized protein n=1 Tax=Saccharibacillus sacchari TaxID=456493 RepID=A0ACC6PHA5_9BACL
MNTNKKQSFFKLLAIPAITLITATLIAPGVGQASEADSVTEIFPPAVAVQPLAEASIEAGALTPPPPPTLNYESFAPSLIANRYIVSAYSNLSLSGSSELYIFARTTGSASASQTGVTAVLQRWTGSSWVEFGSSRVKSSVLSDNSVDYTLNVTKGYYYRVKSDHWASNGANKEVQVAYSNTVFVSD